MREQETALLAGGVSSRCCGAVGLGADEAPSSRSNARFSFVIFLFVFFFCFFLFFVFFFVTLETRHQRLD